jgi:hypothetical protein
VTDVRVRVEGDRYGGVAEEHLDDLGVDSSREEQGGAGVTEVVKADLRRPSPLQQRLERAGQRLCLSSGVPVSVVETRP